MKVTWSLVGLLATAAWPVEGQETSLNVVGVVRPYGTAMACFEWTSEGWIDAVLLGDTAAAAERGYFDLDELFYRPLNAEAEPLHPDSVARLNWEDSGPWGYVTDMVVPSDVRPAAAISLAERSYYFVTDTAADAPFVRIEAPASYSTELTSVLEPNASPPGSGVDGSWSVRVWRATLHGVTQTYVVAQRFLGASSCYTAQAVLGDREDLSVLWQGTGDCEKGGREREPYALLHRGGELFILFNAIDWDWVDVELWGLAPEHEWRQIMRTCAM